MSRVIAIDGPSGAGKSTVARSVGRQLGFLHVDSGALYRLMTWQALQQGVDTNDESAMTDFAPRVEVVFEVRDGRVACLVGGAEPGEALRTTEINRHVSPVSKVPSVRARVTHWLRAMQQLGDLVVEGRDIGTVVFPDTPARFYLDASPQERARRRHLEEQEQQRPEQSRDAVLESLLHRDRIDSTRAHAPLRKAEGALAIDSTDMPLLEVVATVLAHLPPNWLRSSPDPVPAG